MSHAWRTLMSKLSEWIKFKKAQKIWKMEKNDYILKYLIYITKPNNSQSSWCHQKFIVNTSTSDAPYFDLLQSRLGFVLQLWVFNTLVCNTNLREIHWDLEGRPKLLVAKTNFISVMGHYCFLKSHFRIVWTIFTNFFRTHCLHCYSRSDKMNGPIIAELVVL